jgi:hydroxylamine reductase (hybrid-cluster protein)
MEVRMTMDEYLALINGGNLPGSTEESQEKQIDVPKARPRKKTARDRAMKKAIPMANERYKKKNGQFRAGRSQADVMRLANKLADKMMK